MRSDHFKLSSVDVKFGFFFSKIFQILYCDNEKQWLTNIVIAKKLAQNQRI